MRWFSVGKEEHLLKGIFCAAMTAPLLATAGVLGLIGIAMIFGPHPISVEFEGAVIAAQVIGTVALGAFLITSPAGLIIGLPLHFALRRADRQPMWLYSLLAGVGSAGIGIALDSGGAMVLGYFLGSASGYVFWWIAVRPTLKAQKQNAGLQEPGAS
jgi:hypothetical protein